MTYQRLSRILKSRGLDVSNYGQYYKLRLRDMALRNRYTYAAKFVTLDGIYEFLRRNPKFNAHSVREKNMAGSQWKLEN